MSAPTGHRRTRAPPPLRWYPDDGKTANQYEDAYEAWKKRLGDAFVTPGGS